MNNTTRAERLQTNLRERLLKFITDLNLERKKANEAGNQYLANQYFDKIKETLDKLNELSEIAIGILNDSQEVVDELKRLGKIAESLEKRAAEMKHAQDKLQKATKVISEATKFITGLAGLVGPPS